MSSWYTSPPVGTSIYFPCPFQLSLRGDRYDTPEERSCVVTEGHHVRHVECYLLLCGSENIIMVHECSFRILSEKPDYFQIEASTQTGNTLRARIFSLVLSFTCIFFIASTKTMARTAQIELPLHGQTGRGFIRRRTSQWLTKRANSPHFLFLGYLRQGGWQITNSF